MNKKEKMFFSIYILIMSLVVFTSDLSLLTTDLEYVRCGSATGIPKPVPQLTTMAYTILIIGVPLVLIAFGILTLVKALASSNADEVSKAKTKLGKKFVIAAAALLTASIVQFVINRVSNDGDGSSVAECISCFLYSRNCGESTTGNDVKTDTIYPSYSNGAISTSNKSNSSSTSASTSTQNASQTILVGDSRTVGICGYTQTEASGNCRSVKAVAAGGRGYSWFKSTGVGKVNSLLGSSTNNIVILFGVNDVGNLESYVDAAVKQYTDIIKAQKSGAWKNHNVIFVSVAPIGTTITTGSWPVSQAMIDSFNGKMQASISSMGDSSVKFCDVAAQLKTALNGKYTSDKVHYTAAGYTEYYNVVMNNCV